MRAIDPDLLRTFLIVCETGKFNQAAERVGRTQAAVSQQIKRLEELFGQSLFTRDSRNVQLSTAGEILYDYAQKIIALNDETYFRLSNVEIDSILRIGAPEVLTATHLPKILSLFYKNHPAVALDVTCKLSHELLQDYNHGEFDIVLFLQEKNSTQGGRTLYKEKLVWACGLDIDVTPEKTLPLILTPYPCIYRRLAIEGLEKQGRDWRAVLTAHNLSGRISAVKNGLGISLIPEDMLDADMQEVKVQAGLPEVPDLEMAFSIKENANSPLSEKLIDHFGQSLNSSEISQGKAPR